MTLILSWNESLHQTRHGTKVKQRNTAEYDVGGYDGELAPSRARERLERPRRVRVATEPGLRAAVQAKLNLEWSPEQIAAWLRTEYPDRRRWHL